jgi:hypothetical protein
MSSIVVANEYTSVHTKGWLVPKKKARLHRERMLKGECKLGGVTYSNPEEMLEAMWHDTDLKLQRYRMPDQEAFKDKEKQTGKGMWSNAMIQSVLKLNPKLWCEDTVAIPGAAGFYWMRGKDKTFTGACFTKGFLPEFSIVNVDAADLPVWPTYGWRFVLVRLVKCGALTYNQINKVWGEVHHNDTRGKYWSLNIREFRN